MRQSRLLALALLAPGSSGAVAIRAPGPAPVAAAPAPGAGEPRGLVELGRRLFSEPRLSEPPGTSCASCHDPARAFAGSNGSTSGVPRGSRPGHFARRNTPSVLYLKFVPRFHFYQEEDAPLPSAFGGFFWDGRADSIAELILQPLLNPEEMNNRDLSHIASKLRGAGYGAAFGAQLGVSLDDEGAAAAGLGRALEAYLTSPEMSPFASKYDAYIRGRAVLTAQEERGLRLFKDPDKGNCASCHRLTVTSPTPERSMFTDYGYDAVAVPRNRRLPSTRDPRAFDLGLCERPPSAPVPSTDPMWCSSFRTPSLRNVAVRQAFMHNGAFTDLRQVVAFYATRATDPARWYKRNPRFDDVPPPFRGQVNINSIPYNRRAGDTPPLDDRQIDDIVAFLKTLTDAGLR